MTSTISQYETHASDGDQRNAPKEHQKIHNRFHEGRENAHDNQDSKDQRSLNVRAAAAVADEERQEQEEANATSNPPTRAAIDQGHKPSRGAEIDEQIEKDEEDLLQRRGKI
ncbi:hypothetical protein FRB99_007783 [Tulasnella sp. 403]|nr:hypothetical protein FRB99_007783 [Tulasnella sp. 403]